MLLPKKKSKKNCKYKFIIKYCNKNQFKKMTLDIDRGTEDNRIGMCRKADRGDRWLTDWLEGKEESRGVVYATQSKQ